ncbi:MAG: betaine/proline/choline family ABC transporter ATP-binding protein [Streptosporangiales bacterium]|nr:betaine/proline/choline family ABC transporter ATP-binding protein [Streptosporangiales bacterium]
MITFEGVTKRYPDGTVAVDDLTLEIPTGAITVLVGPSGCGKTTTLRMINRMIEPSDGRIRIDDGDIMAIDPPTLRRGIGYVIQQAGLFPHRTILGNISTVPQLLGWPKEKARARATELMELVGLPAPLAERYPHQLSGGQQQRVGVARALAADPPVLLMDEPFSAVDPIVRTNLQDELLRLQAELNKTIVFVTHDIDEAIKVGDRIAVMRTGRVAQYATPSELLAAPADPFVESFLGADRGIRRLGFFAAKDLTLHTETVLPADTMASVARSKAEAAGEPWVLVIDADRNPVGWADATSLTGDAPVGASATVPYGHVFHVQTDSLRAALDAAVLSPAGRAVGVDAAGQVVGIVTQGELGAALGEAGDTAGAAEEAVGGPS